MRNFAIAAGLALAIGALFAISQSQAKEPIMSEGKCWINTSNGNYGWKDCPKEKAPKKAAKAHKGGKKKKAA